MNQHSLLTDIKSTHKQGKNHIEWCQLFPYFYLLPYRYYHEHMFSDTLLSLYLPVSVTSVVFLQWFCVHNFHYFCATFSCSIVPMPPLMYPLSHSYAPIYIPTKQPMFIPRANTFIAIFSVLHRHHLCHCRNPLSSTTAIVYATP